MDRDRSIDTKNLVFGFLTLSLFVAAGLLALPIAGAHAQASGGGTIQGQITNGTMSADPKSTAGLTVTLYSADMQTQQTFTHTTVSDASGRFAFSNLDVISTTRYLADANYQGIDYTSEITAFDGIRTTLPLSLAIYETTDDPSAVHVDQTHIVIDVQTGQLAVVEILQIHNSGDRSFVGPTAVGPHRITLTLPVLAKASQARFNGQDADATTLRGTDVFSYTLPFQPGDDQIVFQYAVPYTPPTYEFSLKLPFDTSAFRLLISDVGETVTSTQLSPSAPFSLQSGQNYFQSTASNLTTGTTVQATLQNLPVAVTQPTPANTTSAPTTAPADSNSQTVGLGVLGAAAIAAIALLLYPIIRRRTAASVAVPASNRRTELLQSIAELDDDFEAGKVSESTYQEERARLKSKLLDLGENG